MGMDKTSAARHRMRRNIEGFGGTLIEPGDDGYDQYREVWNAMVDRRPALIARCEGAEGVVAAIRYARAEGLDIGVKCGGHNVVGHSVPDGGLMIDLSPMSAVTVDPDARRATVQGGALLRFLDQAAQAHGLATTAGNVSHTGVGGLTLGGGMGWLARQAGLACDNVEAYTLVTADGEVVRATVSENADLHWGLRGGGGNFGVVTEFVFRLHPIAGRATVVELAFPAADAAEPMQRWRDLLSDAPREATLTADAITVNGRPMVSIGYVWVGDPEEARAYLPTMRAIGPAADETVSEMSYLELQTIGDANHHHGKRRYANGHYFSELTDAAIEAFISRGVRDDDGVDWSRVAGGGFQAYGGAISDVSPDDSAFSHRDTLVEFFGGHTWTDPAEDLERMASARAYGDALAPFASGVYVNVLFDDDAAGVRRAYGDAKLRRLSALKGRWDPGNVFHLNQNIAPSNT
jgi:FAD/FMN-containing dehydrogenase